VSVSVSVSVSVVDPSKRVRLDQARFHAITTLTLTLTTTLTLTSRDARAANAYGGTEGGASRVERSQLQHEVLLIEERSKTKAQGHTAARIRAHSAQRSSGRRRA
jgi:hypothetical protein